jgi:hypothetical protein
MVGAVNLIGQSSQANNPTYSALTHQASSSQASSSIELHSDPDLLIKEYFRASPPQRAKSRKLIAARLESSRSFLTILGWTHLASTKDRYDGAVDLLAECSNPALFQETSEYLITLSSLATRNNDLAKLEQCEKSWEVLLKGISCAYLIPTQTRLRLLQQVALPLLQLMNRRSIKAVLLDALAHIVDEGGEGLGWGKEYVRFLAETDRDEYIRTSAKEILTDLK